MAGPLKRTNLRSSPEDAAFYRKFHDYALSTLRKGTPREQLLQELAGKGVPEKTADRIVVAVEQELALAAAAKDGSPGRQWKVFGFIVLVWGSVAGYIVWQMKKDGTFHWKYLVVGGVISLVLSARVVSRLLIRQRELVHLPPPPSPGDR
jgi:hypothetical protein